MKHALATLLIGALTAPLVAQATTVGTSLTRTVVSLPQFDQERALQWSSSRDDYDASRADARYAFEQFTYQSDGLTVGAYLYRPAALPPAPLPVIIFNRGSAARPSGFAGEMLVMAHRYARAGFLIVAPYYRGSNGWSGRDELGGAELADLMSLASVVKRLPEADGSRLFLAGESRGGMMVYQAIRDGFRAKAAAVWGAFTDLSVLLAPGTREAALAPQLWPDLENNRAVIIERRSAIRWADRIKIPVLIMHGTADEDMSIEHSRRLDAELTRLGKEHRYREFAGEQHRIGGRGAERDAETIAWFRRFDR